MRFLREHDDNSTDSGAADPAVFLEGWRRMGGDREGERELVDIFHFGIVPTELIGNRLEVENSVLSLRSQIKKEVADFIHLAEETNLRSHPTVAIDPRN